MRLKYTTAPSLTVVDLDKLLLDGKRFVILDIDNTVTEWRSMDISKEVLTWAQNATQKGMTLFLLSNNHDHNRSSQLAQKLGANWCKVPHKKPSQKAFECALGDGIIPTLLQVEEEIWQKVFYIPLKAIWLIFPRDRSASPLISSEITTKRHS